MIAQLGNPKLPIQLADEIAAMGLSTITVNAIRIWVDARHKTHFEWGQAKPSRDPRTCSHQGCFAVRGQRKPVPYTWSRSALFHLCCGDCGARLE